MAQACRADAERERPGAVRRGGCSLGLASGRGVQRLQQSTGEGREGLAFRARIRNGRAPVGAAKTELGANGEGKERQQVIGIQVELGILDGYGF